MNVNFTGEFSLFQDAIIAPLWTDLIITKSSTLYHRVSTQHRDLNIIASLVTNSTSGVGYHPVLAIVVTWENVSIFRRQEETVRA